MKVFAATLAVLLLVAICSLAEAAPRDSSADVSFQMQDMATPCCVRYISRPIPRRSISSAYRTSKRCPQPGVVLVTVRGRSVCASPQESWVQKYLEDFETLEY